MPRFFFQAEDGIRYLTVTGVQTCALPIFGIFVPSWFRSPVRTAYRYLQHWMLHPYLWRWLEGGSLRSWGAKSRSEERRVGKECRARWGWELYDDKVSVGVRQEKTSSMCIG